MDCNKCEYFSCCVSELYAVKPCECKIKRIIPTDPMKRIVYAYQSPIDGKFYKNPIDLKAISMPYFYFDETNELFDIYDHI